MIELTRRKVLQLRRKLAYCVSDIGECFLCRNRVTGFCVSKETLSSIDKTFNQSVKRRLPHSVAASNPSAFQISSRYRERLHAFIGRHSSATEGTLLASCLGRFGQ